jgi:adenosylhomocysteine nucleosidase
VSGYAVVVLSAMPRELRPLVRALRLRPASLEELPAWGDDEVLAVAVGVGPARAGAGAAKVLEAAGAQRVVITGVAGALDTSLEVGDLIRPSVVVDARSGVVRTPSTPDPGGGILATVERVHLSGRGPLPGRWPAGDGDILLPAGAMAVDMETAAIAAACEAKGVPWDVVRAVSDVAGTLTQEAASLLRPDGRADVYKAARLALRDPRALCRLVRLGLDSARAVRVATGAIVSELRSHVTTE